SPSGARSRSARSCRWSAPAAAAQRGLAPGQPDQAFPYSWPGSATEHLVDGLGGVGPGIRHRMAIGDGRGQRLGDDAGDIDLVPPLLDLMMQPIWNLDRVTGHRRPPCLESVRKQTKKALVLQGREAWLPVVPPYLRSADRPSCRAARLRG